MEIKLRDWKPPKPISWEILDSPLGRFGRISKKLKNPPSLLINLLEDLLSLGLTNGTQLPLDNWKN